MPYQISRGLFRLWLLLSGLWVLALTVLFFVATSEYIFANKLDHVVIAPRDFLALYQTNKVRFPSGQTFLFNSKTEMSVMNERAKEIWSMMENAGSKCVVDDVIFLPDGAPIESADSKSKDMLLGRSKAMLFLEAYKQGLLGGSNRSVFEEAYRRGLVGQSISYFERKQGATKTTDFGKDKSQGGTKISLSRPGSQSNYLVTAPDGESYAVLAPATATKEQIFSAVKNVVQSGSGSGSDPTKIDRLEAPPPVADANPVYQFDRLGPRAPLPWAKVAAKEEYRNLTISGKLSARRLYFSNVVAPHVPTNKIDAARCQFDAQADAIDEFLNLTPAERAAKPWIADPKVTDCHTTSEVNQLLTSQSDPPPGVILDYMLGPADSSAADSTLATTDIVVCPTVSVLTRAEPLVSIVRASSVSKLDKQLSWNIRDAVFPSDSSSQGKYDAFDDPNRPIYSVNEGYFTPRLSEIRDEFRQTHRREFVIDVIALSFAAVLPPALSFALALCIAWVIQGFRNDGRA